MDMVEAFLEHVNGLVWGPPMLVLLFGTHLFLTFRLGFIQRHIPRGIRYSRQRSREGAGDISQFGALMTALAATIGTGNIVGVATAIAAGGPGAVLWMWLTGVFGIATKYGEALLAVKYRITTPAGTMAGGPMYVLERGLKCRWLGMLFALFTAVAAFGIGNMVQAHSVGDMVKQTFGVAPWITGAILTVLTFGLLTFVFSTILGWSYYGEKAAEYLFGARVIIPYRALWVLAVMVGSVTSLPMVWNFADIANALMAIPNLVALLLLSGVIAAETREHLRRD